MDLLHAVDQIVEITKDSHMDTALYKKAAVAIKYMSEKLDLTREQCVMMSLFMDHSNSYEISLSDFASHLDCTTSRIIRLMKDVDVLVKKGLVYCSRGRRGVTYRVPWEVIEAFKDDIKFEPRKYTGISCAELFAVLEEIYGMRDENELSTEVASQRIKELLDGNKQLVFVQRLKEIELSDDDELLLVLFSHLFVNNSDDNIRYHDLSFFYDRKVEWNRTKAELSNGYHILQSLNLIEYNNDNGFVDRESFRMTLQAKQTLFPELNLKELNMGKKDLIKHEDIKAKNLYYDEGVAAQVADLERLLDENNYKEICKRLEDKGNRSGFTCLLYGAPGTGKTETVLQLARQTGRDIFQVNISEVKSMWVGESEKNVKNLFDQYRAMVGKAGVAPIFLFNEADAIIGKRQEGAERAVEKMENSIQNIILQEMENLKGILIATTNLAQNMDKAFERRFLYKIKFSKPTLDARIKIWQTMLPELSEEVIRILAEKYDFSGGQMENIARHYAIDSILHGDSASSLETLKAHCENERLEVKEARRIGF